MADYRCIYRNASTGARTSGLSHLEFRVWIQYQLSADDFGVCPALAEKLMGDNDALLEEGAKRVQAAIETLVSVDLCQVFADGRRRYLYQRDWQDWQRLRHATTTSLPAPTAETLRKCSAKTRALFEQFHPRILEALPPHAGACDAPATATAVATASSEGGSGETAASAEPGGAPQPARVSPAIVVGRPARDSVAARAAALGIQSPLGWDRAHGKHAFQADFCAPPGEGAGDAWGVCLPQATVDEFVARAVGAGSTKADAVAGVHAWALSVKARWVAAGKIPGENIFDFWRREWAEAHPTPRAAAKVPGHGGGLDRLMGGKAHG